MSANLENLCSKTTMTLAVLCFCFLTVEVGAFSLTNCTTSGPLNNSVDLKVLCYRMDFQTVPSDLPSRVRYLDISFNSISRINFEEFNDLWNLSHLNISDNKISWIQEGTVKHFPNLVELNLANNQLQSISNGLLRGLTTLRVLHLNGNQIEIIDQYAFSTLSNLKVLNLTKNSLQQVTSVRPVLLSTRLEELSIGSNNFSVFNSDDLSRMPLSLKKMVLSQNPLAKFQITSNIFPNLSYLDISYCGQNREILWNITDKAYLNSVLALNLTAVNVSEENLVTFLQNVSWASLYKLRLSELKWMKLETLLQAACLTGLRVLRLQRNKISHLTAAMFSPCSNLTELDLGENQIKILNPIFTGLTQLTVIRLQVNKLTKVTNLFQNLSLLESLDLSRNKIVTLTCSDFANLTQLTSLFLYSNQISHLPSCVFTDLHHLEMLKLGTNKILTIGSAFEKNLPNLQHLQLVYNKLSRLTQESFKSLSNLRTLDLGENQIADIEPFTFSGLQNLTKLFLSSNRITEKTIEDPAVFSGMPNLKTLQIHSNIISYTEETLQRPPFINLSSLKILGIYSQRRGFGNMPSNLLDGLTSLEMFYGGNMNLNCLHPGTFISTPQLWFLDISKNAFQDDDAITAEVFHPVPKLKKLIISRAQIHSLNFLLTANLSRLSALRAPGNMLDVVNETLIKSLPNLTYLDLGKNTFTCDCSNALFIHWALTTNSTQVIYMKDYICSYPLSQRGKSILDLNIELCNWNTDFIMFVCSSVIVFLTLLLSFINQFLHWQVLYAYYLFVAFLYDSKRKQTHKQHGFKYDAFISYNALDESWIVEELLPHLEGEQGWRLCLHHRDFEPGRSIIDNIMEGIYSSRKTICLITHNYLRSNWCSKEIQMANFRLFDEQKDVLIMIFLEDIPTHQLSPYYRMRKLVKKKTYLKWPQQGEDKRIFWQKLKRALETKEGPEDESALLSGQNQCDN